MLVEQVEDGLRREDELGNRVWRHQVSRCPINTQSNEHHAYISFFFRFRWRSWRLRHLLSRWSSLTWRRSCWTRTPPVSTSPRGASADCGAGCMSPSLSTLMIQYTAGFGVSRSVPCSALRGKNSKLSSLSASTTTTRL